MSGIPGDDDELKDMLQDIRDEIRDLRQENERLRDDSDDDDRPDAPPNDDIVDQFIDEKHLAESTERPYRSALRCFRRHTGDVPFLDVDEDIVSEFADTYGGADGPDASTIVSYLRRLKRLYDWMQTKPWGPLNNPVTTPLDEYKNRHKGVLRRSGQNPGTVVKPEEYRLLFKPNNEARSRAILLLPAKTGLRRKELAWLKLEDVDLDELKVYNRSPKGVGEQRISRDRADPKFIDEETADVIRRWIDQREHVMDGLGDGIDDGGWLFPSRDGSRVDPMSVSRWWWKARERAERVVESSDPQVAEKLGDLSPHDARRCFTSWLNWNDCPRDLIAALRGDADADMVALYTTYGEDHLREEYLRAIPTFNL